jgi:hypothetical protein
VSSDLLWWISVVAAHLVFDGHLSGLTGAERSMLATEFPHGTPRSGEDAAMERPPGCVLSAAESQTGRLPPPVKCAPIAEAAAVDAADAVAILAERKASRTGGGNMTAR